MSQDVAPYSWSWLSVQPEELLRRVLDLVLEAGERVLAVYKEDDLRIEYKTDQSPLTEADMASHQTILHGLEALSDLPVLSEESHAVAWAERKQWRRYWLVDPLDGTKEFINKNGQFTVNICLVDEGKPVLGVVYVPVTGTLYCGACGVVAYKQEGRGPCIPLQVARLPADDTPWRIMGSRSHRTNEFAAFVEQFEKPEIVFWGSSLKLCLVAEGVADLYPRLGPTCEWDTAAGQAVVEAAGGRVIDWETKSDLRYNTKESLLNPHFIACAGVSPVWFKAGEQ